MNCICTAKGVTGRKIIRAGNDLGAQTDFDEATPVFVELAQLLSELIRTNVARLVLSGQSRGNVYES